MPRQKKVVPYVPNTVLPKEDYNWEIVWKFANKYPLQHFLDLVDKRQEQGCYKQEYIDNRLNLKTGHKKMSDYFKQRMSERHITDSNWLQPDGWGRPSHAIRELLGESWPMTEEFRQINDSFMTEYDSRADLQELYSKFYNSNYWVTDRWGDQYCYGNAYWANNTDWKATNDAFFEKHKDRPESITHWTALNDIHNVRTFIEQNRPTPYMEGDLVRLRDPFVGDRHHDPLFTSAYDVHYHNATPTPDKSTIRLGTVMKVTDTVNSWRGSKGSKLIEVLWFGKESTVHIEERFLKWEERPTLKNGLKKRE